MFPFQRNLLTQANDAKNIPLAGREVTRASDTEQKDATPSIPTINEEPQSTFEEDDSPF